MKKLFLVSIAVLLVSAASVMADVPHLINYQGYLTDTEGEPLDTTVAMTFKFYDAATGGVTLWTESQPSCTVSAGLFDVLLGSVTAIPNSVFADTLVWLGITVGNHSEMSPRNRMVTAAYAYRVSTVDGASGGTISGDVDITGKANIGSGNANTGTYAFVAGMGNTASGDYATVGGGWGNDASGPRATVGGGFYNEAIGAHATVGGGNNNDATADHSTVGGGSNNEAGSWYATVGGGRLNEASADYATVGGGRYNHARGDYSVVAGGGGSTEADSNSASGGFSAIGGGSSNEASGNWATVGGGYGNEASYQIATVSGGSENKASGWISTVGGGSSNEASGSYATVGGGYDNDANNDYATVSGGGYNHARGQYSVVAGGGGSSEADSNLASGDYSAIGGGFRNEASGYTATVGGGFNNEASDTYATVGGGSDNIASGNRATIPGGRNNTAAGSYSFAAGRRAKANHSGCFVWGDSYSGDIASSADDQFRVRASGGTWFYSNTALNAGVYLAAGANAWTAVSDSTKKRNIRLVDTEEILDKVSQLPIKQWSYKSQERGIEHIGPMAQDFWKLFHLGEDSLGISTIDPDGIALAAIQQLYKENQQLKKELSELRNLVEKMAVQQTDRNIRTTSAAFVPDANGQMQRRTD